MKIFITGGTGLIGKLLVKKLLERGDDVVVLSRNKDNAQMLLYDKAEIIEGDPSFEGNWQKSIDGSDAVINLAGESIREKRWTEEEKKVIYESRIKSTSNIIDGIKLAEKKPQILINMSAVGYYGAQKDNREINENETHGRDFLAKLSSDWEDEARKAEKFNTRVVRLRTGVVLSDKGGALEKMSNVFKMYAGGAIGTGKQWMPWIHLDDVIGLILFSLDNKEISGPLNCTSPNPVTMNYFSEVMGEILHRPAWISTPGSVLKAVFGEVADVLTGGQRAVPEKALKYGYEFEFSDIKTAMKNLLE